MSNDPHLVRGSCLALMLVLVTACGGGSGARGVPPLSAGDGPETEYLIGPGDALQISVWRNPDLSSGVSVRPDGKISTPLVEDMPAVGKTPTQLARDIEAVLSEFIRSPKVTVIAQGIGPFSEQIRVVGHATAPQAIPYKDRMTLLDVMIQVGGLTETAAGNRAKIVRWVDGEQKQIRVRIDDLINDGKIEENVLMLPGDILIIPQSFF